MTKDNPITSEPLYMHSDDTEVLYVDCTPQLDGGVELFLASVGTPTEITTSDLTLSGQAVLTSRTELTKSRHIAPLKGFKFQCSPTSGTEGTYNIEVPMVMTNGVQRTRVVQLIVSDT